MVKLLLERTEIDINRKNRNGDTALISSLRYGTRETENIPILLIQSGANVSDNDVSGERDETPLFLASRYGSPALLKTIMKYRVPNVQAQFLIEGKRDPLINCIRFNPNIQAITYLIETLYNTNMKRQKKLETLQLNRSHFDAVRRYRTPAEVENISNIMQSVSWNNEVQSATEESPKT